MNWTETNSLLKGLSNHLDELPEIVRVAAFDLDDTIINRPTSRAKTQKWKLMDNNISKKIAKLVNDGYIIVFFSNQSTMGTSKTFDKIGWRKAIQDLLKIIMKDVKKYYFAIYVAKKYDLYRKPNIGMWEQMKNDLKDEFDLDKLKISKKSFFCGDAAGRTEPSQFVKKLHPNKKTGDHSDTDIKFALNIGINFLTPEEFYLKETPKMNFKLSGVNPKKIIKKEEEAESYEFIPRKREMIIMVGMQGSGKTEFVNKYILAEKYVHINRDTCKTKAKCLELTREALEKRKSVVIDNTNPDVMSRMEYTTLAQEYGYTHIRAIIMCTDDALAKHLNNVRHVYSDGTIPKINNIGYRIFQKNYVKPQKCEHFDLIEKVNFAFDPEYLDDPLWKKIFMRWSEYQK